MGAARFAQPSGIAVGPGGALYVGDACNNRIAVGFPCNESRTMRKVATAGAVSAPPERELREEPYRWEVFVGRPGEPGGADGVGSAARLSGPQGLAWDADGSLLVADGRCGAIRKVSLAGEVTTLPLQAGTVCAPLSLAAGRDGELVAVDGGKTLWRVNASGAASKLGPDGAKTVFICGVAIDGVGHAVIADYNAHVLRRVAGDGTESVWAGRPGQEGTVDGVGANALFSRPAAIAFDSKGTLYVATAGAIRKVTPEGLVSTLDVGGGLGRLDGIAVDRAGNVYAADRERHAIWKVPPRGGAAKLGGSELAMGGGGWLVTGLAVDREGNVYVADAARNCVMKGSPVRNR